MNTMIGSKRERQIRISDSYFVASSPRLILSSPHIRPASTLTTLLPQHVSQACPLHRRSIALDLCGLYSSPAVQEAMESRPGMFQSSSSRDSELKRFLSTFAANQANQPRLCNEVQR
jgi:hypothetical protein